MSLIRHAARIAIGIVLAIGPILGCEGDDDYYGGFGGGFAGTSSSGYVGYKYPDSGPGACGAVAEGIECTSSHFATSCEVGTNPNANCNAHFACGAAGTWKGETPQRAVCAPQTVCPEVFTESAPDLCKRPDALSLLCEYDEGTCGCSPVGGLHRGLPKKDGGARDGGDAGDAGDDDDDAAAPADAGDAGPRTYEWKCVPNVQGCPRRRPREGVECVRPLNCDYGYCVFEDGYRMDCYSGTWVRDLTRSEQCDQ